MNADFRKVALIAAALGLVVSLFFALRPNDDDKVAKITTTAPTTELPSPTTTLAGVRREIQISVVNGRTADGIQRESVDEGDEVVIEVRSDVADHVHLHGYDLMADVAPGKPATLRFAATAPGRFEIELEERGLEIAELEVRP